MRSALLASLFLQPVISSLLASFAPKFFSQPLDNYYSTLNICGINCLGLHPLECVVYVFLWLTISCHPQTCMPLQIAGLSYLMAEQYSIVHVRYIFFFYFLNILKHIFIVMGTCVDTLPLPL